MGKTKQHMMYSWEETKKILEALEALNRNYELERYQQPTDYIEDGRLGKIPKARKVRYVIDEFIS